MLDILTRLIPGRRGTSVQDRLRYWTSVSDAILAFGFFSIIFFFKLDIARYYGTADFWGIAGTALTGDFWSRTYVFVAEQGLAFLLYLFTFGWYFLYKNAVRNEIDILVRLYSQFRPPHDWERLVGHRWVGVISVGITVAFLGLAWFVDEIKIYCIILILLNILDLRGNTLVRRNLARHFEDAAYTPDKSDPHEPYIMRRRAIAKLYWIDKPHLERIAYMMLAFMVAFLAAVSEQVVGFALWPGISYIVIMAAIAANEVMMARWRYERDREVTKIDADQVAEDRRRTGEALATNAAAP